MSDEALLALIRPARRSQALKLVPVVRAELNRLIAEAVKVDPPDAAPGTAPGDELADHLHQLEEGLKAVQLEPTSDDAIRRLEGLVRSLLADVALRQHERAARSGHNAAASSKVRTEERDETLLARWDALYTPWIDPREHREALSKAAKLTYDVARVTVYRLRRKLRQTAQV